MIKKCFSILVLTIGLSSFANAAATLSFSGTGARAIGFLDANGNAVTGMRYGILIDSGLSSAPSAFASGSYGAFDTAATVGAGGVVNVPLQAGGFSGDYFYTASTGNTTVASITASGADSGGAGAIGVLTGAPTQSELQVALPGVFTPSSSYKFGIIWFDTTNVNGPSYGFYTDSTFILPTAGPSVPFNSPFVGTSGTGDGAKLANNTFAAAAIPEPSRMMLLGFGLVGLFYRRRR
jgi:hypothetical protein